MKYKYEYKGVVHEIGIKDLNKIDSALKVSLKRKLKISIYDYLSYLGFELEKCRICKCGNVPLVIESNIIDGFIIINGFKYTKKIYCYKDNMDCEGIKMNSNSFEFISLVENVTLEEANRILKERNNSPFYKENWKSDDEYRKSQSRSLGYYIEKYGEEEGVKKYDDHINKISYSNSLERYIEEFGEEEGVKIFNNICISKDSMSYDLFLLKNNYDRKKALCEYTNRLESVNNSVESLIKKYGEKTGIFKHMERVRKHKETWDNNPNKEEINKTRSITIDNLYRKYGDMDIANEKYNNWLVKITVPITRASKESLLVFKPLMDILGDYNIQLSDIYIGYGDRNEYFIKNDGGIFFYDFTIKSKKIIIEYNGTTFHPKNENSEWVNPFNKNITPKEAYNKQQNKVKLAESLGFKVLEIWSDEDNNFDKCLEFIKKYINI